MCVCAVGEVLSDGYTLRCFPLRCLPALYLMLMFSERFQVDVGETLRCFDLRLQRRRVPAEVCVCAWLLESGFTDAAKLLNLSFTHRYTLPFSSCMNELLFFPDSRRLRVRAALVNVRCHLSLTLEMMTNMPLNLAV